MSRAPGVAALGVTLCLLAAAFAASSLYVAGAGLVLIAAGAEASTRLAAWRVRVHREPGRATLEEGDTLELAVEVRAGPLAGGGRLAAWPGAPETPLRWRRRRALHAQVRLERRGAQTIGPSTLTVADPFGLSRRELRSAGTEVLVLPRVEPLPERLAQRIAGAGREAPARRRERSGGEADSLRPYRPGAPASRIHWPAVARTGELIERRLASENDTLPLVVLDATRPAGSHALDACARAAASLCVSLARVGGCALLLPGETRAHALDGELGAWPALHARLALLGPGGALSRTVIERAPFVVWISAQAEPEVRIAHRAGVAGWLVTPTAPGVHAELFRVAGCAVRPLGPRQRRRAA